MANFEEISEMFKKEMKELGLHYHEETFDEIAKYLGPSIYDADGSLVACSDPKELKAIKENFLMGTLELPDTPALDKAMEEACHALGESNKKKHSVTFHYLLMTLLNAEEKFIFKSDRYPYKS